MSIQNDKLMNLADGKVLYDDLRNRIDGVASDVTDLEEDVTDLSNEIDSKYEKPSGGIPATDLASGVIPDVSGFYTKPQSGIPASDLASGVIPDISGKLDAPSTAGTSGQVLGLDSNLEPVWMDKDVDPEVIAEAVDDWLDDHPDATTTVEDGSITKVKLHSNLSGEIDRKAPAIMDVEEDYRHTNVSSFTMIGNEYAFGNARYANKKDLIIGYDHTLVFKNGTANQINGLTYGNIVILNGTNAGGSDDGVAWDLDVDLTAGSYIFKIEPYVGQSVLSNGKNMHLDLWYDGNTTTTRSQRVTLSSVKDIAVSSTFTLQEHAYKIRIWCGIHNNTYSDYRLFYSLFPSDVTITDTGETISSTGTLTVTPASEMSVVDTMMHKSETYAVIDTKTYIDNHTQEIDFVCFRPEDYGAKGDGVADDSTALQDCINAAQQVSDYRAHAIRGYGTYKISTGIVFNCRELDVYINKIIYTGNDSAVTISASYSEFAFNSIRANAGGASSVGIKCYQSSTGWTNIFYNNNVRCNFLWSNGNTVEFAVADGVTAPTMYYDTFYFKYQRSTNANIIHTDATLGEVDFHGKYIVAPNGFLYHADNRVGGISRFFNYSLEADIKNGANKVTRFYYCRSTEMENLQSREDRTSGHIFAWENEVPDGIWEGGSGLIDLASIDVTNAYSWEDALDAVKEVFDSGKYSYTEQAWTSVIPTSGNAHRFAKLSKVGRTANANLRSGTMRMIQTGDAIVYYKNIAFKPDEDIYYKVTGDMTILLSDENDWEYVTPTTFDIDTSSATITLDASYCCIAIDRFDVIQHTGKTAIVIDKLGNTIFDGTNLGAGVYHFKCSFVEYEYGDIYITQTNGTVRYCNETILHSLYSGSNEKWTVTREELIDPPAQV